MRKCWKTRRKNIPGVYVEWYDEAKRRRSKYFSPHYRARAEPFLQRKTLSLNSDTIAPGGLIPCPYDEAVTEYLKARKVAGNKESSRTEAQRTLDIFGSYAQIDTTNTITQNMLDDFILHRRETKSARKHRPVSLHTLNKDIRNLIAWLHWAQDQQYVAARIKVKQVKAPKPQPRALTNDEVKRLIQAAPNSTWYTILLLLCSTGLRREDLRGLSRAGWSPDRCRWAVVERKTGKASWIPIPRALVPCITGYLRLVKGPPFGPWQTRQWAKIIKAAKLPGLTPHDLRGTFATLHAEAGTPIHIVQRLLHHSDIKTTMTHYIGQSDKELADAAEKLDVGGWIT